MSHHPKKEDHKKQDDAQPVEGSAVPRNGKIEVVAEEYEALKKKVSELEALREKFLMAAADFENAKKRNAKDKEDFIKFSQERILRELLPVLDNFDRAVGHANTASANVSGEEALRQNLRTLITGVEQVKKQLFDILKLHGLKRIDTAKKIFDPHFHEVVAHVPEEGKEDEIVDELESGFMLHDRLLRAAKVRVRVSPRSKNAFEEKQDEIT